MNYSLASHTGQKGVSLVIALVFLVAMTLIGIAALNNNTLQLRMANNSNESNTSFQNAETALSFAEQWIQNQTQRPSGTADTTVKCGGSNPVYTEQTSSFITLDNLLNLGCRYDTDYVSDGTSTVNDNRKVPGGFKDSPLYVIEEIRDPQAGLEFNAGSYAVWYYRVTAVGYGVQEQSDTINQSIVKRHF